MIRIMVDAAADLSVEEVKKWDIEVLPFTIHFSDESVTADENLKPTDFYAMLKEKDEIPSTSQMSPSEIEDRYRKLGKDGDAILHISISSAASGIFNTATMVAASLKEEGFDITLIDSTTFSRVIGVAALEAAKMAKEGKTKEEIVAYLEETYKRDTAYFMVDDLAFLKKGGRIKATTMAIGTMLDIKPILNVNDGLVEAYRKVRGTKKAIAALCDYVKERMDNPAENVVHVLHIEAEENAQLLKKMIEEKVGPKEVTLGEVGPIITSHAGLGVVGVFFKHAKPYETYEN